MKKTNLFLLTLSLGLGAVGLASCKSSNTLFSKGESFRLQAVTSMNVASNVGKMSPSLIKGKQLTADEKQKVLDLLPTVDLLLDNGSNFSSTVVEKQTEIEGVTYSFEEVFTFSNAQLKQEQYTIVYNKTLVGSEVEGEESESTEKLEGYAIFDETTKYKFTSIIENEIEGKESECERMFKIDFDETSYVKVEQEFEQEGNKIENEFKYTLVEKGVVVSDYSIEVENKENKSEIEFEIGTTEYSLERKGGKDGEKLYDVKVVSEGSNGTMVASFRRIEKDGVVTYEII